MFTLWYCTSMFTAKWSVDISNRQYEGTLFILTFSDFKKLSSGSSKPPKMQRDLLLLLPLLVLDHYSTLMTATTPAASLKQNIAGFWQLSILTLLEWPSFLGSAKAASGTSPRVLAAAWRVRLSLSCKQETISGMFFLSPCWDPAKKSCSIHSSTEA